MTVKRDYPTQPLLKLLTELKNHLDNQNMCPDEALKTVGLYRFFSHWERTSFRKEYKSRSQVVMAFCDNLYKLSSTTPSSSEIFPSAASRSLVRRHKRGPPSNCGAREWSSAPA